MNGGDLPDSDHVVRYARFTDFLDDEYETLNCSAFQLRPTDSGLSVNWLECFEGQSKPQQLNEVRRLTRLTMKSSGRLAELNVGVTREHIGQRLDELRFTHTPLPADENYEADPSHSEIMGAASKGFPRGRVDWRHDRRMRNSSSSSEGMKVTVCPRCRRKHWPLSYALTVSPY